MTPSAATSDAAPLGVPAPEEADLVARLRRGEDEAFEELVRGHGGRLLAVARRLLGSEDDAQDAVQDAFLSAFRALGGFAEGARLGTWLHRIVVNAALMRLRTRRRKPERLLDDLLPRFAEDGHQAVPAAPWSASAEAQVLSAETRAFVRESIGELPEIYRTVLLLRDIDELDTGTVAELLDVSASVVKTRLHRGRLALRTLLDRRFRGDPR